MPMCYGTIFSRDEFDLSYCTCDPNDPAVARMALALRTERLLRMLRDKRRLRQAQRLQIEHLVKITETIKFWTVNDLRRNADVLRGIALALRSDIQLSADAVDPVDGVVEK